MVFREFFLLKKDSRLIRLWLYSHIIFSVSDFVCSIMLYDFYRDKLKKARLATPPAKRTLPRITYWGRGQNSARMRRANPPRYYQRAHGMHRCLKWNSFYRIILFERLRVF